VRNAHAVKILNKSPAPHAYRLGVSGLDAAVAIIGDEHRDPIEVQPDGSEAVRVTQPLLVHDSMTTPQNSVASAFCASPWIRFRCASSRKLSA